MPPPEPTITAPATTAPATRHRVDTSVITDDLAYQFDGVFTRDQVAAAVEYARTALEPQSRIPTFLPILVTRYAKEQLTATAQAEGTIAKTVPEILFVCVHNAGRSQMAAAIAAHLAPAGSTCAPPGPSRPATSNRSLSRRCASEASR